MWNTKNVWWYFSSWRKLKIEWREWKKHSPECFNPIPSFLNVSDIFFFPGTLMTKWFIMSWSLPLGGVLWRLERICLGFHFCSFLTKMASSGCLTIYNKEFIHEDRALNYEYLLLVKWKGWVLSAKFSFIFGNYGRCILTCCNHSNNH